MHNVEDYPRKQKRLEKITAVCYYDDRKLNRVISGVIIFGWYYYDNTFDYKGQHKMLKGGIFCMPAQWTGDIVGEMHLHGISAKALAAEIGWHEKYLSAVLNGHREPKEAEDACRSALNRIISRQVQNTTD